MKPHVKRVVEAIKKVGKQKGLAVLITEEDTNYRLAVLKGHDNKSKTEFTHEYCYINNNTRYSSLTIYKIYKKIKKYNP